jgi:hypothetical protein
MPNLRATVRATLVFADPYPAAGLTDVQVGLVPRMDLRLMLQAVSMFETSI